MSMQYGSQTQLVYRKTRRLSTPVIRQMPHQVQSCSPLPTSVSALDLQSTATTPVAALASLRETVLSHLADLERRLAQLAHTDFQLSDPRKSKTVEDAKAWAGEGLEMLWRIRADVCSHLPDVPFDSTVMEELYNSRMHDFSYTNIMDDIRARLPDIPHLRSQMSNFDLSDVQSRIKDLCSQLPAMPIDFKYNTNYLPTLSHHLQSLHTHIYSSHPFACYNRSSLPSTASVSEMLDRLLSSDFVPDLLHRVDGHESKFEKATRELSDALKQSVNGSRLVTYVDLPAEWRNNPFVARGYRFIPLHRWPVILLSLFAMHNETLNIHTHLIPLLHTALDFIPSVNYAAVPLDRPERIFTLFAQLCLLGSVVWHTMAGCAHRGGMELCARVDYVGIGWLISATIGTIVYYGLSCHAQATFVYLSLCVITGLMGSIFPFMNWFNDRRYRGWRVLFFLCMAFTGLAPLVHLSFLYGSRNTLAFITPILPSLSSYVIGLIFYVTHIPECYLSRHEKLSQWTDWLGGGSHAIWHAFIVLAIYQHKWGMRDLRAGVANEGCLL